MHTAPRSIYVFMTFALSLSLGLLSARASVVTFAGSSSNSPDVTEQLAAAQLASDFGLTTSQALNEVVDQRKILTVDSLLRRSIKSYAGAWIDHANDVLHILIADKSDLSAASAIAQAGQTEAATSVDVVQNSLTTLDETYEEVNRGIQALVDPEDPNLEAAVDIRANIVQVNTLSGHTLTSDQQRWLNGMSSEGLPVAFGTDTQVSAAACGWPTCDPPLRGGTWMSRTPSPSGGYCSSGFTFVSLSDGKPYMSTAGHCGTNQWYDEFTNGVWHGIGSTHSIVFGSDDSQIVSIANPSGWQSPGNTVLVYANSNPSYPTTTNTSYGITGEASPTVTGIYICHTGATSLTNCGMIVDDRASATYDGQHVYDLFRVKGIGCQGDSGGASYVSHLAFGMMVAYSDSQTFQESGADGGTETCSSLYWYVTKVGSVGAEHNVALYTGP